MLAQEKATFTIKISGAQPDPTITSKWFQCGQLPMLSGWVECALFPPEKSNFE
jgi:hypothetical protein